MLTPPPAQQPFQEGNAGLCPKSSHHLHDADQTRSETPTGRRAARGLIVQPLAPPEEDLPSVCRVTMVSEFTRTDPTEALNQQPSGSPALSHPFDRPNSRPKQCNARTVPDLCAGTIVRMPTCTSTRGDVKPTTGAMACVQDSRTLHHVFTPKEGVVCRRHGGNSRGTIYSNTRNLNSPPPPPPPRPPHRPRPPHPPARHAPPRPPRLARPTGPAHPIRPPDTPHPAPPASPAPPTLTMVRGWVRRLHNTWVRCVLALRWD